MSTWQLVKELVVISLTAGFAGGASVVSAKYPRFLMTCVAVLLGFSVLANLLGK